MYTSPRRPGRLRTPLIVGATVLSVALFGGALHWAIPGLVGRSEPVHVDEDADTPSYAGDYLVGEAAWGLSTSRLARTICETWTEEVDGVTFSEQVASDHLDPGAEFLALEREIDAPRNGASYRNDVVLTHNTWYTRLREGTLDVLDGDPVREPENVMVLGNVSPLTLQYVVGADSDIHTLEDLAGTTALIAWEDPETLELSDLVLLAAGLDPLAMDVTSGYDFDTHTPQQVLIEGDVDVYVLLDEVGNAELDHFERQGMEPRVLEIPEEVVATVGRVDPSYTSLTVEAGTLPGHDGEVNMMASWEALYAHADLDEDLAYELVGAVYEDLGDRVPGQVTATVEQALSGVAADRVHPGAARYFSERGVL